MTNERTEVLAANQAFYQAFEKKDIDAMSAVWSQGTGSLCIHPGRNVLRGWQPIRVSWEQIFRKTKYLADSARNPTSYPIGRRGMNCIPLESCFLFVLNIHDQGSTIIVKEVILS